MPETDSGIEFETRDDNVGVVTFNRPEKLNAFHGAMRRRFSEVLADDAFQALHVVVLQANGRAFSAGLDLSELGGGARRPVDLPTGTPGYSHLLRKARPVVIAAVQGHAVGMGADIAVSADLTILADDAEIGFAQIDRGLVPGVAMVNLKQTIPAKHALQLLLTGRAVGADEALALGLANEVVPLAGLRTRALALAEEIARKPLMPLRLTKRLFHECSEMPYELALQTGARANTLFRSS